MLSRRLLLITPVILAAAASAPDAENAWAGGGGCHDPSPSTSTGSEVRISQEGCFAPTVLFVDGSGPVVFSNESHGQHNVVGLGWGSYAEGDGLLATGESFAARFDVPGYYPFACTLHLNMVGVLVVGDPPDTSETAAATSETAGEDGGIGTRGWALIGGGAALGVLGMLGGGVLLRRRLVS